MKNKYFLSIQIVFFVLCLPLISMAFDDGRGFFRSETPSLESKPLPGSDSKSSHLKLEVKEKATSPDYPYRNRRKYTLNIKVTNMAKKLTGLLTIQYAIHYRYRYRFAAYSKKGVKEKKIATSGEIQIKTPLAWMQSEMVFSKSMLLKFRGKWKGKGRYYAGYSVKVFDIEGNLLTSDEK